jgi:hypothetical protein
MEILKHVYAIKELINNYDIKDRNSITNLYIEHILNICRSNLLNKLIESKKKISKLNYSSICLKLELYKQDDCHNGCFVLRTNELPEYIGSINVFLGNKLLSYRSRVSNSNKKFALKPDTSITYYINDKRIYILGSVSIDNISVTGMFLSDKEINNPNIVNCLCTKCLDDYHFTLDPAYISDLYSLVIQKILSVYGNNSESKTNPKNNGKDM